MPRSQNGPSKKSPPKKSAGSRGKGPSRSKSNRPPAKTGKLRIIGGRFRGRQLEYSGDPRTRPMKDNIREAVFNLIGGWIPGKHVIDLFAGTGAIGLEALSRGAEHVTLIERHFPTARIIRDNVATLEAEDQTTIITSDTFFWVRQFLADSEKSPEIPWAVFCSPPYDLYEQPDSKSALLTAIEALFKSSPVGSVFVVESDQRFDTAQLPSSEKWRVRNYALATVSIFRDGADSFQLPE